MPKDNTNKEWDWKSDYDWTDPEDVPYETQEEESPMQDLKEVVYGK